MYKLLTHPVIADNQPPILICCNKSDHLSSITLFSKWQLLKKLMEEEM